MSKDGKPPCSQQCADSFTEVRMWGIFDAQMTGMAPFALFWDEDVARGFAAHLPPKQMILLPVVVMGGIAHRCEQGRTSFPVLVEFNGPDDGAHDA